MNRKIKNSLALLGIFIFIAALGGVYSFVIQKGKIKNKTAELKVLVETNQAPETLLARLTEVKKRALVLDSILSARKFNIPRLLSQTAFYNFVNKAGLNFDSDTHIDIEYQELKKDRDFNYYIYKVSGIGQYNDLYSLLYAIEQSRELKKIKNFTVSNYISVDEDGIPTYMVNFNFQTYVYFANDDRFTTTNFVENNLQPVPVYDFFYPLIRNELPPNSDGLLDVTSAKLLALIPEGAFIADSRGNTFMLWEGDQVYLGYLTKIDYENNQVTFILNKGGIIEKIYLKLEKEDSRKKK